MFFFWFVVFIFYLKDNALIFVILICFSWNRAAMLVCESIRQIRGQKIYSKNKMFVCRQGGRIANLKNCYNIASIILYHYDNHPTYRFMLICCLNYLSYFFLLPSMIYHFFQSYVCRLMIILARGKIKYFKIKYVYALWLVCFEIEFY